MHSPPSPRPAPGQTKTQSFPPPPPSPNHFLPRPHQNPIPALIPHPTSAKLELYPIHPILIRSLLSPSLSPSHHIYLSIYTHIYLTIFVIIFYTKLIRLTLDNIYVNRTNDVNLNFITYVKFNFNFNY